MFQGIHLLIDKATVVFIIVLIISVTECFAIRPGERQEDFVTFAYNNYNQSQGLDHWEDYGKHYSHHLHGLLSYNVVNMLEIGVASGGSSRVWNDIFRGRQRYVGIDVNPKCEQFSDPEKKITIVIGSQLNQTFLSQICQQFGPFDLIVDDGGHTSEMVITSFESLWPCMIDKGIYAIEDLHAMWMWKGKGGMLVNGQDVYDYFGQLGREATSHLGSNMGYTAHHPLGKHVLSMHFYDSLIFLHYRKVWKDLKRFRKGETFL